MKKLVNPQVVPIGGFKFKDPDTGFDFVEDYKNFEELEAAVQAYRENNKLPRINAFRAVWEHYICENVPLMGGRCTDCAENIKRTFKQYFVGGKSFVKAILAGAKAFVSQEVADRRSAVCAECDQNVRNIGHAHSQFYSDKYIKAQVGARKSFHHEKLKTCKICTCILQAKVFYDDEIVASSITDDELVKLTRLPRDKHGRRLKCWQLECLEKDK